MPIFVNLRQSQVRSVPCILQIIYHIGYIGFPPRDCLKAAKFAFRRATFLQNIDHLASSCERCLTSSVEGHTMQTRFTKWFEAEECSRAFRLDSVTAILSIFAIAAAVTVAITAFA
jgi:hypothetical protein